jgi:hypothetical protein
MKRIGRAVPRFRLVADIKGFALLLTPESTNANLCEDIVAAHAIDSKQFDPALWIRSHLMIIRICIATAMAAVAPLAVPAAAAQPGAEAGFVLSVEGVWFTSSRPTEPLSRGEIVREGDWVWVANPHNVRQSLSLALYGSSEWLSLSCARAGVCNRRHPVRQPSRTVTPRLRGLLSVIGGLVRKSPDRFAAPDVRGDERSLKEGILVAHPDGIDLGPVLRHAPGYPLLEVASLDSAASPGPWRPLRVRIAQGAPPRILVELSPGFYSIRRQSDASTEAWVLVVADGEAVATDTYRELVAYVSAWGEAGAADARLILRAYLYSLARAGTLEPTP